jgi:site-specific DNA recombinase
MRAAIYARYSTDRQNETSITAQVNACSEYCKGHQIEIASIFMNEAKTGTNMQRDGFMHLMAGAKAKDFDAVKIYDITRGSRDVGDWFEFRKLMAMLGITVISATEKLGDITDPNDFMVELITVGMGQHHVLQTRQKSRDGIKVGAAAGKFCGGTPPLGYRIVDSDYKIDPHEAAGVRMMFEAYASGKGFSYIVDQLAAMRIKSKRGTPIGKCSSLSFFK